MLPYITTTLISLSRTRQETENGKTKKEKTKHCKGNAFHRRFFKTSKHVASKHFENAQRRTPRSRPLWTFFFLFHPIFPFPSLSELLSRETGYERGASINSTPPLFAALPQPQSPTCLQHSATNCNNVHEGMRDKTTKCQLH